MCVLPAPCRKNRGKAVPEFNTSVVGLMYARFSALLTIRASVFICVYSTFGSTCVNK